MSGGIPIPKFGSWATEANYPAGANPWNGQPTKVAPVGDIFTPNTKPPAQTFNAILSEIAQDNTAALQALGALPPANWFPQVEWEGGSGPVGPYVVKWNDQGQTWLLAGFSPGGSPVVTVLGFDGQGGAGTTWGSAFGSNHPPCSIAVDTAGNVYVAAVAGSGANNFDVWRSPATGGAFVHAAANTFVGIDDVQLDAVGTNIVFALGVSSGALDAIGAYLSGGIGTFTTVGLGAPSWILKSNGSVAIAIPRLAGGGNAYSTPDGVTLTHTSMTGQIGATDVPIDAAWNAQLGLWAMAVAVAGGSHVAWYTSTTGLAWTATGTVFTNGFVINSVSAIGPLWVAIGENAGHTGHVVYSFDATTWYPSGGYLYSTVANSPIVRCSPNQIAIVACLPTSDTADFNNYRFSFVAGLPDQVVT